MQGELSLGLMHISQDTFSLFHYYALVIKKDSLNKKKKKKKKKKNHKTLPSDEIREES